MKECKKINEMIENANNEMVFSKENIENEFGIDYDAFVKSVALQIDYMNRLGSQHKDMEKYYEQFDIQISGNDVTNLIGGQIGEVFKGWVATLSNGLLTPNPADGGYPDDLYTKSDDKKNIDELGEMTSSEFYNYCIENSIKKYFIRWPFGGREFKAVRVKWNVNKKGEKTTLSLKPPVAHHNEGKNLCVLYWDVIEETKTPYIVGIFFVNNLTPEDWGTKVVPGAINPKTGNQWSDRATSGCALNGQGKKKLLQGWLAIPKNMADFYKDKRRIGYDVRENRGV